MPKLHLSWLKSSMSALLLACLSMACVTACDRLFAPQETEDLALTDDFAPTVVFKVAYENKPSEPLDLGMQQWKHELEKRSFGTMTLELYPDSKLGGKTQLLDRIAQGENIITTADGAFFYGLGQKEMGIVFGPYLASNWDEAFNINKSVWYQKQTLELAARTGIKVISADWAYGLRHLLTTKELKTPDDINGLRIRVPSNIIQEKGFEVFGAKPVKMPLGEVNAALSAGQIDGLENPITTLYNGGFHHTAKYLMLTGHVYNVLNIVISDKQWNSLNASQQKMLVDSCSRAARFYNMVQAADELTTLAKMEAEGVHVIDPDQAILKALRLKALNFYELPVFSDWPENLYRNLQRIKLRKPDDKLNLMTHSNRLNVSYETPEELQKASEAAAATVEVTPAEPEVPAVETTTPDAAKPAEPTEAAEADEEEEEVQMLEGFEPIETLAPVETPTAPAIAPVPAEMVTAGEAYYAPLLEELANELNEFPPKDTNPIWNPETQGAKVPQLDIPVVAPLGDFARPAQRQRQGQAQRGGQQQRPAAQQQRQQPQQQQPANQQGQAQQRPAA